jgi:hypothetical protein
LVEHRPFKAVVAGSIPARLTKLPPGFFDWGLNRSFRTARLWQYYESSPMADFDPNAPATKGDVIALKSDVIALKGDMVALEERLTEAFRDVQTELLKAFYSFATTADAKFKDGETSDIALRQRVSVLETRMMEVEKRLNFPPAA